jgi:phosphatidylglycerol---prolipoprotein diacylglyceryl transferase
MFDGPGIPYYTFPNFSIGPLTLNTFGLFVALGIFLGIRFAARRNEKYGVPQATTEKVGLILVVAGLIGARLFWVVTNLDQVNSFIDVIAVWRGGLQFSGGFVVAIIIAPFITRRIKGKRRWQVLDGAVLGLALGQGIGRCGCIAVCEHMGNETDFFLGTRYLGGDTLEGPLTIGVNYHNTAVYEMIWVLILFAILWYLDRRRSLPPGAIVGLFMVSYGIGRFSTDFLRAYDQTLYGLTGAQYMSIFLFIAGVVVLAITREKPLQEAKEEVNN